MKDGLFFHTLGPIRVTNGGELEPPRTPRLRQVLALLVVSEGNRVTYDDLVMELWGGTPPKSAIATIQTFICQLRRTAVQEGWITSSEELFLTCPRGYRLAIRTEQTDVNAFIERVREGRHLLDRGRTHGALEQLKRAEELWKGDALCDVSQGSLLSSAVDVLKERRIQLAMTRVRAEALANHQGPLVEELRSLVREHPLNEWFHQQLISALIRMGRRAEALSAFESLRHMLENELGVDPDATFIDEYRRALSRVG